MNKEKLIEAVVKQIAHDVTLSDPRELDPLECLLSNIDNAHLIAYLPEESNLADHGVYGQSDFLPDLEKEMSDGTYMVSPNIGITRIREQQEQLFNMYNHLEGKIKGSFALIETLEEDLGNLTDVVQEIDDERLARKVTRELDEKHGIGTKMSAFRRNK